MNAWDRMLAVFSPAKALRNAQLRDVLAEYEGGKPSRLRKAMRDARSPDTLVTGNAERLRNWARHQERNLDVARGALNTLVRNVVGPDGIGIEPMPTRLDGSTHDEFADQLMLLWRDWIRTPEVTWRMDWPACQRMLARSWLRDGESFAQVVEGLSFRLDHGTRVPLSLELLEPDLVPLDYEDLAKKITQGIELNDWGRPRAYYVYKRHPGDLHMLATFADLKRVDADRVLHLALRDRLHQLRGVSIFASVINRLEDIKDYEDSERVAAKIAAALTATIKRGPDGTSTSPGSETSEQGKPLMKIEPGMIFDGAGADEEIVMVDAKRPSAQVEPFRNGQLRAAASGLSTSYSSLSKNYDGTWSAQRQELVEQKSEYQVLTNEFINMAVRPIWERFVPLAILSGAIRLPVDLDPATMVHAQYMGPPMPWIDPMKEAEANRLLVRTGFKSSTQVIRELGGQPWQTAQQIADERDEFNRLGITLESDPATTPSASTPAPQNPAGQPAPDDPATAGRKSRARKTNKEGVHA